MKVKIYTFAYNRPDFIPLQFKSIHTFIKDNDEYIVLNNGVNESVKEEIKKMCEKLNIKNIMIDHKLFSEEKVGPEQPSIVHGNLMQWAFTNIISNDMDCISCIIDSDMFFISPISFEKYLSNYDIASIPQYRNHIKYPWGNLLFMKMNSLPNKDNMNFMPGIVDGIKTDTGGQLYYWIQQNKKVKIKWIPHTSHIRSETNNLHYLPDSIKRRYKDEYKFEIIDNMILHYGRGSNWDLMTNDYHEKKTNLTKNYVEGCIKGEIIQPKF